MTQQLDRPAAPMAGRSRAGERRNGQPDRATSDPNAETPYTPVATDPGIDQTAGGRLPA